MITKESRLEEIGHIIRMPESPEKLRAIAAFWMSDPIKGYENRRVMAEMVHEVRKLREATSNKWATSSDKNSGLRHALSLPVGLNTAIKSFITDYLDGEDGQKQIIMTRKAFPELCVAEKF